MKLGTPPLRFLALVVGGWAAARTMILVPWGPHAAEAQAVVPTPQPPGEALRFASDGPRSRVTLVASTAPVALRPRTSSHLWPKGFASAERGWPPLPLMRLDVRPGEVAPPSPAAVALAPFSSSPSPADNRWSGSAWGFFRRDGSSALAPGGSLGGSQFGARFSYRVNGDPERPLALTARLYVPVEQPEAADMAAGIEWQPIRRLPVRLLAERRQALGEHGRSDFALLAHGGASEVPVLGLRLDAYGQAGVVGLEERDFFADGAARLSLPLDRRARIRIGVGAWAAAQPGVSRVDVGPQASFRLPVGEASITVAADWRLRVSGNAAPRSGPALTLATDF